MRKQALATFVAAAIGSCLFAAETTPADSQAAAPAVGAPLAAATAVESPAAATAPAAVPAQAALETAAKKLGYAMGLQVGASLDELQGDLDLEAFILGVRHACSGGARLMSDDEAMQTRALFFERARAQRAQQSKMEGELNQKEGEAFLEANKEKEGVIVTESGLQYKVVRQGDGPRPTLEDQVKVDYRGTLIDGTVFDSSYERGEPIVFKLGSLIPGWQEGIQLMPVGSKYQFFIPGNLAYGERGAGAPIGPNKTLIFEVELLDIVK